jgi:raffinose/stachyose/melibiose transport system permease protein
MLKPPSFIKQISLKFFRWIGELSTHLVLCFFCIIALFPIGLVIMNSFKTRKAIFGEPFSLPLKDVFTTIGYTNVLNHSNFPRYFYNSMVVSLASMFLILLLGSMVAFALSEYKFPGNAFITLYLMAGIMIPMRLGTVSIMRIILGMGLINTLTALIVVNVASGLPVAVFILQQFMRQVPKEMKDAARIDGASEYRIYTLILPLVKPAIATVAVYSIIPIWNDLWFPLILAPSEATKTLTLGAQQFIGQYIVDWNSVLSSLTLAIVPILVLYILFSRQLIGGLTQGALK